MKQIILKKIEIKNFKGIKELSIECNDKVTNIYGQNAAGKTTIFDAFIWVLFGKNSNNKTDFEIKTLDVNNAVIPKIEHEVSVVLFIGEERLTLRKVLKEKWVKKKGSLESEFTGNETLCFWNEVPVQLNEYKLRLNSLLSEDSFKLITNPFAFNSLPWKELRSKLESIVGEIPTEDLIKLDPDFEELSKEIESKTVDDYKKQTAASIKKLKEEIKTIPTRIDEVNKSIPESFDFELLKADLGKKNKDLEEIEFQLNEKQTEIFDLKRKILWLENEARIKAIEATKLDASVLDNLRKELDKKELELKDANRQLSLLEENIKFNGNELLSVVKELNSTREEWSKENAKEFFFDKKECVCPTCNRGLETDDIEIKELDLKLNFTSLKLSKLKELEEKGVYLSKKTKDLEKELEYLKERLKLQNKYIDSLALSIKKIKEEIDFENTKNKENELLDEQLMYNNIISDNKEYSLLKNKIEALQLEVQQVPAVDLKIKKSEIQNEIDSLKSKLAIKEQIEKSKNRISELEQEECRIAQLIASLEKTEFVIQKFIKLKIENIENKINSKFKKVKFKMFENQINEGEVECCKALVNGVPFADANNAGRVNAGLDVINTLSEYYRIKAPIFIDNREGVTELIDSDCQIINLIVSKEDKVLRVE